MNFSIVAHAPICNLPATPIANQYLDDVTHQIGEAAMAMKKAEPEAWYVGNSLIDANSRPYTSPERARLTTESQYKRNEERGQFRRSRFLAGRKQDTTLSLQSTDDHVVLDNCLTCFDIAHTS